MSGMDLVDQCADQISLDEPRTDEERQQAREQRLEAMATVCHYFPDRDERWLLYEALGLTSYQRGRFVSYQYGREPSPVTAPAEKSGRRALPYRKAGKARAK